MTNEKNLERSATVGLSEARPADPHSVFSGLWLPLITPFRNNAVDHTALARLVQH